MLNPGTIEVIGRLPDNQEFWDKVGISRPDEITITDNLTTLTWIDLEDGEVEEIEYLLQPFNSSGCRDGCGECYDCQQVFTAAHDPECWCEETCGGRGPRPMLARAQTETE